jgi:serralysin
MTQSTITITGTEASQYVVNTSTISPFSNVVIADSAPGQIETVTVSLEAPGGGAAPGNGALSNLGAGSYDAFTGTYTVTGTAAEVTAALNNLVFTPTTADQPEHSVFAINVVDSAGDTALNRITTVVSAHPITIATNGVTTLASVANGFIVENLTSTAVSFLKLNGSVVTTSTFAAGWTAVGAVQTGSGYEVAFSAPVPGQSGQTQYVVWNVDSNGNYISNATGVLSGTGAATELAAQENRLRRRRRQ